MFQSARLKLTGWYLLIIMFVSILFSLMIYSGINREFDRFEHFQKVRLEQQDAGFRLFLRQFREDREQKGRQVPPPNRLMKIDLELMQQARNRIRLVLISINLGIMAAAGALGYFLAGKTLRPIKDMVDDQKRFITDASHELRTPLTIMRTEIEVSLRDQGLNVGDARRLLQSNLEEVINLQALSDSLIRLSQYQKASNGAELTELLLEPLIDEAVSRLAGLAKQKSIYINRSISNHTFMGIDDGQAMTELFVILLDNAIKYSDKGKEVIIKSTKTDDHIIVEVKDQGIGIDKGDIPHIFDRFYRADKARGRIDTAGYGLGLSIAKQIAEKHHGSINVKSESGKGTTFTLKLPAKRTANKV